MSSVDSSQVLRVRLRVPGLIPWAVPAEFDDGPVD